MSGDHKTFIQTPKQFVIVVLVALAVPIAVIVLLSQLVSSIKPPGPATDSQVLSRIKPFGELVIADASTPKGNLSGEQVYQAVCKTCHEAGIAGAPKVGDRAAWAAPIKKGYATLVQHAIKGFQEPGKVMPPKGGNPDLTGVEEQRRRPCRLPPRPRRRLPPLQPRQARRHRNPARRWTSRPPKR